MGCGSSKNEIHPLPIEHSETGQENGVQDRGLQDRGLQDRYIRDKGLQDSVLQDSWLQDNAAADSPEAPSTTPEASDQPPLSPDLLQQRLLQLHKDKDNDKDMRKTTPLKRPAVVVSPPYNSGRTQPARGVARPLMDPFISESAPGGSHWSGEDEPDSGAAPSEASFESTSRTPAHSFTSPLNSQLGGGSFHKSDRLQSPAVSLFAASQQPRLYGTDSQVEFFKMLDKKIEEGPDYESGDEGRRQVACCSQSH